MFEMAQIRHALKLEKEASRIYSWRILFATPGNRKRMRLIVALAVFSQWRQVTSVLYEMAQDVLTGVLQWKRACILLYKLDFGWYVSC